MIENKTLNVPLSKMLELDIDAKNELETALYQKMDILSYEECVNWFVAEYGLVQLTQFRMKFIMNYAWAIPNTEAITTICEHGPITEIGCGNGYWAWRIRQAGGDIQAYDSKTMQFIKGFPEHIAHLNENAPWEFLWKRFYIFPIPKCASLTTATADRALMLCWPPYADPMAYDCLLNYQGDTFIYIGEYDGGCCGDKNFSELLFRSGEWELTKIVDIPRFRGLYDSLFLFKRCV